MLSKRIYRVEIIRGILQLRNGDNYLIRPVANNETTTAKSF